MYNDEHNLYHYTYRKDGSEAEAHPAPQPGPVQDHNSGPQQPVQEMKPVKKNRIGLKVTALALCCALLGGAFVTSNRESGDGRYDIQLKPTQKGLPGILIELKAEKNCSDEKLKKLSETALQQINDKKYETELTTAGVRTIYKYGVAFSGKKVEVAVG